jgi:hypothetical protein
VTDDNKLKTEPDKELVKAAFEQLMGHIRQQDDLCHSWTKYYLSIQSGLAVAFAVLMKLVQTGQCPQTGQPSQAEALWIKAGSLFIALLGILTAWFLTAIIHREQSWQGRYIVQVRRLPLKLEVYRESWGPPDESNPEESKPRKPSYIDKVYRSLWKECGYIGQRYTLLWIMLSVAWIVAALFAISR